MLDRNTVYDILTAALSTGGTFAEIFVENKTTNSITLVNNKVDKAISGIDHGAGIRIFNGLNAVYSYTNDTTKDGLLELAKNTAKAIKDKNEKIKADDFSELVIENKHNVKIMPFDVNKNDVVEYLLTAGKASMKYSDLITQTTNSYLDIVQDVLIANSEGVWATDRRVRTRATVGAIASKGNEKQTALFAPGARRGFELFDSLDIEKIGHDMAETAVKMVSADLCPSGRMPVIIDNKFGGVIFHEACGHSLEATSVAKGASVFSNRLGEQIANEKVTAIDDGTIPNAWGSLNIDDEGTPTQKNVLIENGILKSYLVDKLNGLRMETKSTGSGRRESYKYAPTSRMTNTYIDAGNDKVEDIISSVDYGLFAKTMGGGSVNPATGEFNFSVNEGYLIRNGKIAEPVRGATLIGSGAEVLKGIDMVSDNLDHGQGMCGSQSGSIPTNVGQPMIRVKELTVGGRADINE